MSRIKYRRFIRGKIDLRSLFSQFVFQQKFMVLIQLRKHTKNWKGVQLLDKLIKKSENAVYFPSRRAAHAIKKGHRVAHKQKCLIIGAALMHQSKWICLRLPSQCLFHWFVML